MGTFRFRLQPLLDQRIEMKNSADEALAAAQKQYRVETEALATLEEQEAETQRVLRNKRSTLLDTSSGALTAAELDRRTSHIRFLKQQREQQRDAVFAQRIALEELELQVEAARERMLSAKRDVEVLEKYREKQENRFRLEAERREELELDETGTVVYSRNGRQPGVGSF